MISDEKTNLLTSNGYFVDLKRGCFFNKLEKKIFSFEFVEQKDLEYIEAKIKEEVDKSKWNFYFVAENISDSVMNQLTDYFNEFLEL